MTEPRTRRRRRATGTAPRPHPAPHREDTPPPPALHWIVPARRAVVCARISYGDLLNAWEQEIQRLLPVLAAWYFTDDDRASVSLLSGLGTLHAWLHDTEHAAALSGSDDGTGATLDDHLFRARLWKGPLRVLKELQASARGATAEPPPPSAPPPAAPPRSTSTQNSPQSITATDAAGDDTDDPDDAEDHASDCEESSDASLAAAAAPATTELQRRPPVWRIRAGHAPRATDADGEEIPDDATTGGVAIRLELDEHRAAIPGRTNFFVPGDVVELPLWRILMGTPRWSQLEFNPEGSFLLGTSVRRIGDTAPNSLPPRELSLHDNALFMRYQSLLSLARGAFYSLRAVYAGNSHRHSSKLAAEGLNVEARGLMYASSLANGGGAAAAHVWLVQNSHWGVRMAIRGESGDPHARPPLCLPTATGLNNLRGGHLTPGWTCTPSQCFFFTYMLKDLQPAHYVRGDPMNESLRPFLPPPAPEGHHATPPGPRTSILTGKVFADILDPFVGRAASDRFLGFESWVRDLWTGAERYHLIHPPGAETRPPVPPPGPMPAGTLDAAALRAAIPEAVARQRAVRSVHQERRHLTDLHVRNSRHDALAAGATAATSASPPLGQPRTRTGDMLRDLTDLTLRRLTAGSGTPRGMAELDAENSRIAEELSHRRSRPRHPPVATLAAPFTPDDGYWQQVNCIVQGNHSFGIVRLRPADRLADEAVFDASGHLTRGTPPHAGFLSAYDPMSGLPDVTTEEALHRFEAAGSLAHFPDGHGHTFHVCGSQPHHVDRVERFDALFLDGLKIHLQRMPLEGEPGTARTEAIIRIQDDTLTDLHATPAAYEPIGLKTISGADWLSAHPATLYAERAVPTPTFEEALTADEPADRDRKVMPPLGQVRDYLTTLKSQVEARYSTQDASLAMYTRVNTLLEAVGSHIRFAVETVEGASHVVRRDITPAHAATPTIDPG